MAMIVHHMNEVAVPVVNDDGHEYHLTEQQHDICANGNNHQRWLLRRYSRNWVLLAVAAAAGLVLLLASVASDNRKNAWQQQQCPSEESRWIYYNGAYFMYDLYLQQWPNPDPKILILHGGGWADENGDDPNQFSFSEGCSAGGWSVTYGKDDGSTFTYEYIVQDDASKGGTFSIGGVEYDLINNGSVFLVDMSEKVTQLGGLDLSSLVIDKETVSVASVTEFCYSNQEILDFFDNSRANYAGND